MCRNQNSVGPPRPDPGACFECSIIGIGGKVLGYSLRCTTSGSCSGGSEPWSDTVTGDELERGIEIGGLVANTDYNCYSATVVDGGEGNAYTCSGATKATTADEITTTSIALRATVPDQGDAGGAIQYVLKCTTVGIEFDRLLGAERSECWGPSEASGGHPPTPSDPLTRPTCPSTPIHPPLLTLSLDRRAHPHPSTHPF